MTSSILSPSAAARRLLFACLACVACLVCLDTTPAGAAGAHAGTARALAPAADTGATNAEGTRPLAGTPPAPIATATVTQCVTAVVQAERSATFSGEMTAVPGTARMAMRIELQQRMRGEQGFHTVSAPGLGAWRDSEKRVKVYKSLQQVTNLVSPAVYRASISFRWLNAKGRLMKRIERLTPKCAQPAAPPLSTPLEPNGPGSSTPGSTSTAGAQGAPAATSDAAFKAASNAGSSTS